MPGQGGFVLGKGGPLEVEAADLPLQLPNGPRAADAFDFVECTFQRIVDGRELLKVAIGQGVKKPLGRHTGLWGQCPHFCDRRGTGHFTGRLWKQSSKLWGQRLHNLRISLVEISIAVELPAVATSYTAPGQPFGKPIKQLVTVLGSVLAL